MAVHRFTVVIERDEEGYFAFCPELQGCYTQGKTYEEVLKKHQRCYSPAHRGSPGKRRINSSG